MIAAGVPLPEAVVIALGDAGEPCFAFNEIAFAVAPKRLEWSWSDFKKQQGYGQEFLCIVETGDEAGVSGEGVEYGTMTVAAVMLQQISAQDRELEIDLFMPSPGSCRVMCVYQDVATIFCILARHDPGARKP